MQTHRYRITFGKGEALRFVGHLDLHRAWERTFRRAGTPLAFSEGFNPRPRLNIGAALPLGCTSQADLLDVHLAEAIEPEDLLENLRQNIPPGLEITAVESVERTTPNLQKLIRSAEFVVPINKEALPELEAQVSGLLDAETLPRTRRGKDYDLRPLIEELEAVKTEARPGLRMRLAARPGATGRPDEVLKALGLDPLAHVPHRMRLIQAR